MQNETGRRKRGRPRLDNPRNKVIVIRVNDPEFHALKEFASQNDICLTSWARDIIKEASGIAT